MRYFKVLDSSNIGMGRNFEGQVLALVGESVVPGCVVLKQPQFDANGTPCAGVVTFDSKNVIEVPNEL